MLFLNIPSLHKCKGTKDQASVCFYLELCSTKMLIVSNNDYYTIVILDLFPQNYRYSLNEKNVLFESSDILGNICKCNYCLIYYITR